MRLSRFIVGEKKGLPFFLRRLEKVSILFEAARKKFPFFLRRLEKSFHYFFEAARKKFPRAGSLKKEFFKVG